MSIFDETIDLFTSDHLHILYSIHADTDTLSNDHTIISSITMPCTNIKAIKHILDNRAIALPTKSAKTISDAITSTTIIYSNAGTIILIVIMVNQ